MRKSRYANCIFIGIVAKRQVGMYSIRDSDGIIVLKCSLSRTYIGTYFELRHFQQLRGFRFVFLPTTSHGSTGW